MKRFAILFVILFTLYALLPFGHVQNAVANEADWMPDANLRTAVRTALGLGGDDTLTQAAMTTLTELRVKNASIVDITGLEHGTNLTKLDLRRNSISSITALSGLTNLTHLWLAFNSITDISALTDLTNLTTLTLRDNQIGDITDLGNLTNLTTLWIKNCGITDVSPLRTLVNLTTLRIAGNSVTNAHTLSRLTNLNDVDIDIPDPPGVSISVPEGVQNSKFEVSITFTEAVSGFEPSELSLEGSTADVTITSWETTDDTTYTAEITPTTSGTVVLSIAADVATDAANNGNTASETQTVSIVITPPADDFVSVCDRTTDVRNAIVAALPNINDCADVTTADLATIRFLDGESLRWENITALKEGDFNGLTALEMLHLSHNSLSSLPAGIFDDLTALEYLYLDYNNLSSLSSSVFDNLTALKGLYLDYNNLSSLSSSVFDNLTALKGLHLGDNDLSSLPSDIFEGLTTLEILHLGSNDLSSLPSGIFDKNTALTELQLRSNSFGSLPSGIFENLTALTYIHLNSNNLVSLPSGIFDKNTALTDIGLQYNDLSSLPSDIFENLTALKKLNLGNNSFGSLPSGIFDKNTALTALHLGGNDLSSLPEGVFEGLTTLESLHLHGNTVNPLPLTVSLKRIEEGQFKATVHTGAPPSMTLTASVVNGSIDGGTNSITIPVGTIESETFTVTRTTDTKDAVSVDIKAVPQVPRYKGYEYVKSTDLPLTVIDALGNAAPRMTPVDEVPSETALSANYPNPFNPETWIPYQLSNTSDVKITIYDVQGRVIRQLDLGHQREGYYTSRSRAAYWDGRNDVGERVATGIYFYQLQADNMSLLRKMLILK